MPWAMGMHFMRMPVSEGAAFVELAVDYSESFGSSGYLTGCVAILEGDFVKEIS